MITEFDFSYRIDEKRTFIHIFSKEVRTFLYEETGSRWVTIHLEHDSPLLTMLHLRFKGRKGI